MNMNSAHWGRPMSGSELRYAGDDDEDDEYYQ